MTESHGWHIEEEYFWELVIELREEIRLLRYRVTNLEIETM